MYFCKLQQSCPFLSLCFHTTAPVCHTVGPQNTTLQCRLYITHTYSPPKLFNFFFGLGNKIKHSYLNMKNGRFPVHSSTATPQESYDIQCTIHTYKYIYIYIRSRGSSVGIATRYGLDGTGIECWWGGARFSAPVQTGPGALPAPYTMGTGSLYHG